MAARNRPRNGLGKDDGSDAHEERTMWNSIVNDLRKLKTLHARASEVAKQQVDLEAKIAKCKSYLPLGLFVLFQLVKNQKSEEEVYARLQYVPETAGRFPWTMSLIIQFSGAS